MINMINDNIKYVIGIPLDNRGCNLNSANRIGSSTPIETKL